MEENKADFLTYKQRVKFIGGIMPLINFFIVPFLAYSATNKIWVICLGSLNPIVGLTFLKLSTRFPGKETIFKIIPFVINGTNAFIVCWIAGANAPCYFIGIPFIGACTIIFTKSRQLIFAIVCALAVISAGSYLAGKETIDVINYNVILLCYSFILIRMLNFTLIQGREIGIQKKLIEEKNKDIIDSINYAKRIQHSQLPTEKYISKNLNRLQKNGSAKNN